MKSGRIRYGLQVGNNAESGWNLQDGETIAYKWVTARELRGMPRDELATMRQLNFIEELN